MISSRDFDRIIYHNPEKVKSKTKTIDKIIGLDTEAYTSGEPFMFCTSLVRTHTPDEIPHVFFTGDYIMANFMLWNMKYDSGALLYHLPLPNLLELWEIGSTKFPPYRYKYIPHKLLRIYHGKQYVSFWDIAQFFRPRYPSLDQAAKKYLNKSKSDIATKRFSRKYVKRFWKAISKYCIQDASLTAQLADYFINKLLQFGINPTTLYSSASISFQYFKENAPRIVTAWRYWNECRPLLKFAVDSYEGGKFEVTQRGRFCGYEYDITSAYPYEIANLIDISRATYSRTKEYQPKAVYGFLRCLIYNPDGKHIPCGIMINNVRIYPAGRFYLTITKEEYEYLLSLNITVEILDAYWLFVKYKKYPYRKPIQNLFKIKDEYKKKNDPMLVSISKIGMNGFYGKTVQALEIKTKSKERKVQVGQGWNPIYGSVITANTRIKITKIQNLLQDSCLAVHTDSAMTTSPIPDNLLNSGLGEFEYVDSGKGVLIACGMYQIGTTCAFKGFKPRSCIRAKTRDELISLCTKFNLDTCLIRQDDKSPYIPETWETILSRKKTRKKLKYRARRVESWVESMAKNHGKTSLNVFSDFDKEIDLNCDVKRIWPRIATGHRLLSSNDNSLPKIRYENNPPKYWLDNDLV